ncbi:hypothetical protein MBLNU13_g02892t1 [Cladosporium sp. NU13]
MYNILSLAAGASALALPAEIAKRADQRYDSNFDDLSTTIVSPNSSSSRPIEGFASVVPHSKSQQAGAVGPLDLLQLGELILNTYAQTIASESSDVNSFDLESFWFGSGTNTGTTAGLAQPGTLSVVAYTADDKQLPVTTFSYVPDKALNANLVYAELPASFKNLKNVTWAVASSEPISEHTYIALDNVKHVSHLFK